MQQVIQSYKTGQVTVENVPVPQCGKKIILVRNCHSLISIGTERATIALGKKSLLGKAKARPDLVKRVIEKAKNEGIRKTFTEAMGRLDTPTPLGYSAAGIVVEAGIEAHGFSVDDRVACIGQGFASHAEYIAVPVHLAVKIPETVTTEFAAFGMLGCIALHGIRCADLTFGARVAVIGLGLLGQLTVQMLKAYGCDVFAYDLFESKTTLSKDSGADFVHHDVVAFQSLIYAHTENQGVDAVIITAATDSHEPVDFAVDLCRQKGKIVVVGVADIHPNRHALWEKEIALVVSKAAGPGSLEEHYEKQGIDYPIEIARWTENRNLQAFIRLLDQQRMDLNKLITQRFSIHEAERVYADFLANKLDNPIGVLFEYPNTEKITRHYRLQTSVAATQKDRISVSVIGAGLYGKAVFLPVLKKNKKVYLKTLVANSGVSAQQSAKRFGFENCTTDAETVFKCDDTDGIIALTPHSQHANLISKAIAAKKPLLIEKPLCINQAELLAMMQAYHEQASPALLMIGHNRRYSPHSAKIRAWMRDRVNSAVMMMRINAGFVPADHWVHSDTEGRSRIVGEMSHFIDFMQSVLFENPVSVFAQRVSGDDQSIVNNDNVIVQLQFDRGSIATLVYTAQGNRAVNREYSEIFFDGKTIVSVDFHKTVLNAGKRSETFKTSGQSLGYAEEIAEFIDQIRGVKPIGNMHDTFVGMQTVFAIEKSLATNEVIQC